MRFRRIIGSKSNLGKFTSLYGKNDFPSVREMIDRHEEALKKKDSLKSTATSDPWTRRIAKDLLKDSPFPEMIMMDEISVDGPEIATTKVSICNLSDYPQHQKKYEENKHKAKIIGVGGPAAEDQSVIAAMMKENQDKEKARDIEKAKDIVEPSAEDRSTDVIKSDDKKEGKKIAKNIDKFAVKEHGIIADVIREVDDELDEVLAIVINEKKSKEEKKEEKKDRKRQKEKKRKKDKEETFFASE